LSPALGAAVAILAVSAASASPQAPPPVFDATASIVLVDVVVTDRDQRPVLDLSAADFEVFEDGARREIVSFAAFGAAATKALARAGSAPLEEHAAQFVYASTALVIDEGHLSPQQAARLGPALGRVLRGLTERRGWLLVLAPLSNVALAGRLPEHAAQLTEAAGRIQGRRFPPISRWPMTDAEALEIERGDTLTLRRVGDRFQALNPLASSEMDGMRRARGMATQMENVALMRATELASAARARRVDTFSVIGQGLAWLARQPGRHSLLLVSPGFPHDPSDPSFGRLVTESLRVNAPIHFLDVASVAAFSTFETIEYRQALPPEARVSLSEAADAAAGTDQLAQTTGGLRVGGSDLAAGLTRLLDTTRTYYVLGYEPVRRKGPGFRKIKVEVKGGGKLGVLARRGYFDEGAAKARGAEP
jgi:VWFA-related protein